MDRISRRDIEIAASIRVQRGPKDMRRAIEDGTMLISEAKIKGFVEVVLDEVFRNGGVVVRPSRCAKPGDSGPGGVGDAVMHRPGRWGEDEPWPFDGDPPGQ